MKNLSKVFSLILGPSIVLIFYLFNYSGAFLYYPALMSFGAGSVFLLSGLFFKPCLILRFAKLKHQDISAAGEVYCRRLNILWVLILYLNAVVSVAVTLAGDMELWALYNGLLSYVLLLSFAGLEYLYRGVYREKYENS